MLEDSQQGDILFEGEAVRWRGAGMARVPADRTQVTRLRTNLSMVFQQFNLWSHMTILQNVMEAPVHVLKRNPAEVEGRARALLARSASATRPTVARAAFGRQQQRAAIARALCMSRAPCCWTSRPARWTPNCSKRSCASSRTWPPNTAPCCW
ncbi:ATP-binding cassette domain-containing protein [Paracoccus mutanolyticus]|uniref:ATP-binding cassette domain-containing protein n=1 Tax=Paracoccus mutanolyticus TaxID=1499308 RepID=UPI0037C4FACE